MEKISKEELMKKAGLSEEDLEKIAGKPVPSVKRRATGFGYMCEHLPEMVR